MLTTRFSEKFETAMVMTQQKLHKNFFTATIDIVVY